MVNKSKVCLATFLLWLLFITVTGEEQDVGKNSKQALQAGEKKQKVVTGAKAWALGCSALLTEKNHGRHDLLGTGSRTPKNIKKMQGILAARLGWGIKSKSDLFDWLRRIDNGGHRKEFEGLGRLLQTLSEQEYKELLQKYQNDQEILQRIRITKEYYEKLGPKSILGWDYSRYICLCGWGYMAGYITEQEAWEEIMPIAKMLQMVFDSWEDLGRNYLIGRQFWSYEKTQEEGYFFEDAFRRLIDMKSSPWNKYPWDMDLPRQDQLLSPPKQI